VCGSEQPDCEFMINIFLIEAAWIEKVNSHGLAEDSNE
jgi:hypothetical protein